ncbi:16S rRNA (adenine(1518)-N(6)/adenine(1519)-N(6))-dimethyltransferase RsmA [Ahrensia sp. R2A130]|uniref:16S rRNA (adenine(1518)-N(6)/adenine(1519)-N(6))- dimethyltransferase RsmA n=1 Tax=Ahrensia sp. R2A130 TaxID=744979 RepID=UPI0001E09434|nr:16S rRNA (adenine(1518)-N(6)/adenine(1519)-N(6))-dimethyltransferase RsmA [Ahrensia sp. R2A130]EFL90597.1 dimethyladenosine transferase [Ahrensia sp. R2A130]
MSHIDDLPPLREVIDRHELATKKSLGQNFLLDLNITMKIARAAGDLTRHTVLEIGPGPGGLTRALLASGAKHVVAIERDARCIPVLAEISDAYPGRLTVIEGDALALNHEQVLADAGASGPVKIAANLPYNIATPLFTGWITGTNWPPFWNGMTLMFQREVAQRICAEPGDKAWGRLGVLAGWRSHADIAFDLSPQAFWPPPKVTSSVVMVQPRAEPLPVAVSDLEKITQAAFGQRRKMLRQSLKSMNGASRLEATGIEGTKRAEELAVEDFVALANEK